MGLDRFFFILALVVYATLPRDKILSGHENGNSISKNGIIFIVQFWENSSAHNLLGLVFPYGFGHGLPRMMTLRYGKDVHIGLQSH
jgi:hypothetical protein